jgi:hypothetical protein
LFGNFFGEKMARRQTRGSGQLFNGDQLITGSVLSCLAQDNQSVFYNPLFDIPLLDTHPASSLISKFGILTAHVKGWWCQGLKLHDVRFY